MSHTNLWDHSKPADTDLANTLGDVIRDLKIDITERMTQAGFVWHNSQTTDGDSRAEQTTAVFGTQDNFVLEQGRSILVCSNPTQMLLNGVTGGVFGRELLVLATSAVVLIGHQAGTSTAVNRFTNLVRNSVALTPINQWGFAKFYHDGSSWVMIDHDQGTWLTPAHSAANFTGAPGGWVVGAPDVVTMKYSLKGRMLRVAWKITATDTSGSPAQLTIGTGAWGGFTCVGVHPFTHHYTDAGGGSDVGLGEASGAVIQLYTKSTAAWANGANVATRGSCQFEVAS